MSFTNHADDSEWMPVLRIDEHSWWGIFGDTLAIGDEQHPKRSLDLENPIGLLPCLERSYKDVSDEIRQREHALGLPAGTLERQVSFDRILQAAVSTRMEYWLQLALDWASDMDPAAVNHELLRAISASEWASQRARHRAGNILRRRQ